MLGMEFQSHDLGYAVAKALFGRGILISGTYINAQVLRVEPPLVITYPELDRFLAPSRRRSRTSPRSTGSEPRSPL